MRRVFVRWMRLITVALAFAAHAPSAASAEPTAPASEPPRVEPAQQQPPEPAPTSGTPPSVESGASPAAPPAAAPSASDIERAKQSFKAGAAAYAAGDYLAAIEALEAAYALTPLPPIAFSLAQAERRQYFVARQPEHLTRSIALFRRYLEQTPSGGRRADAIDALAQLEPILAKLDAAAASAPAAAPERRTRLIVFSETPGAQISVDGARGSGSPLLVDVSPGKHRVEVRAPGFAASDREVTALSGELLPVSVSLVPLPSHVELSTPPGAEIYVDGVYASQGGDSVALTLPSGTHRISVAQNGHRVATRELELGRGEKQTHHVTLEPTAQRQAAHALFIGGGAAALAGTAFSVLALRAESSAQEFLDKQARENVSVGELVRYGADRTWRNRYRWLAGASFGAGLGMLITGLFLHELDEPEPEDLYGPSPLGPREDAASRTPRSTFSIVDLSATIAPGEVGATLRAEF